MGSQWASQAGIDDVIARQAAITGALPAGDGVATFNRMYAEVTRLVRDAIGAGTFGGGPFLERLDVHFAALYFDAYDADLAGAEVPAAWRPLFSLRARTDLHPVQFALAGMTAHISHDLPCAVVTACRELAIEPVDDGPAHLDFLTTNRVLEAAQEEIKGWFSTGVIAEIDRLGGRVDDAFATYGIHTARALAWEVGQALWRLADNPVLDRAFRANLATGVALTARGLLL